MAWFFLLIASVFEVGWPLGFKLSDEHPEHFWMYIFLSMISMSLSGIFLYFAQRTIPVSTAYVVWTGLGALGTLLVGIFCFGDSASVCRLLCALLVLAGVVGLELTSPK